MHGVEADVAINARMTNDRLRLQETAISKKAAP
jgi:hypothetical protein